MPTYDRSEPAGYRLVDEWGEGSGGSPTPTRRSGALETALATARRRFHRTLLENGGSQLRALTGALGD